mgnify:CR=1 FL=1
MKSRYNPVLLAVIVIGLVCALWLNYSRYEIEEKNNTVEMAMEYDKDLSLIHISEPTRPY